MSKASRDKGKRGERALAAALREAFPVFADRIKRGWQTRFASDDPDICGLPGFWIECKVGARVMPFAALQQAEADRGPYDIALAVCKYDRGKPFCTIALDDMVRVLRAAYGFDPALPTLQPEKAAE